MRALDDNEPSLLLRVAGVLGVMVVALRCYSDMHTTVWPLFFVVVVVMGASDANGSKSTFDTERYDQTEANNDFC